MPSSAIVTHSEPQAVVPKSSPPKTFLLPFGKTLYTVPESAFEAFEAAFAKEIDAFSFHWYYKG